ncbi:MAG TPA: hypothetical protein VEH26_01165 [Chthoniobacterales bacterium]|nr:hypothetical protein [Chthoniobacterales bacterium]
MTDPDAGKKANRVLFYKIIVYVAVWIAALLFTAPGLWALAYMFPLGLIAVFDRHLANDGGWGVLIGLTLFTSSTVIFISDRRQRREP